MMQVILPRSWKEEFAAAAARREDILYAEKMARFDERERERRKEESLEGERRDIEFMAVVETVLATSEEIAAFRVELDEYDTKTVEALMENREALEAARKRIEAMLEDAYVLPDGRKVFKTKDGLRVFDQNGQALPAETIDPNQIDNKKPRWEEFKEAVDEGARLAREREQLLTYQAKLDKARELLDKGEITYKELESLKADLAEGMPDTVRTKLDRDKPKADASPARETAAAKPALPADMDDLIRSTGLSAGPTGP